MSDLVSLPNQTTPLPPVNTNPPMPPVPPVIPPSPIPPVLPPNPPPSLPTPPPLSPLPPPVLPPTPPPPPASPPPPQTALPPLPTTTQPTPKKKSSNILKILIILIPLVVISILAYLYYQQKTQRSIPVSPPFDSPATSEQVNSPELTAEQDATLDPTTSWETYTNPIHNISFKYPSSWVLSEKPGSQEEGTKDGDPVYNTSIELTNQVALIRILLNVDGIGGQPQTYEGEKFIIDSNNLYQYHKVNDLNDTKEVGISNSLTTLGFFSINDITYLITISYPIDYSSNDESALLSEFDQILSTFKFSE
ncbi:MAG: hypothetical protein ABII80_00955 [bacterium]